MGKLRLGIVGAGSRGIMSFGRIFGDEHGDTVEVAGLAEPNRARAEAAGRALGLEVGLHSDVEEMFGRRDIDAIVVTSPDWLHEEHCVGALEHGKHVLVDKPLAITAKGCLRIIEAAKRSGRALYMGFNLRHNGVLQRLKKVIDDGEVGEVFSMQAVEHYNGGRTYMSRWNRLKRYSGGLFIHKGSHDFDIINWMMGGARPVRVSCFGGVSVFKREKLPFELRDGISPGPGCSVCPYGAECPDRYVAAELFGEIDGGFVRKVDEMWAENAIAEDGYRKDLCMYLSDKDTHDQGIAIVEYDNGATASHSEYFATPITNRHYLVEGTRGHAEADLHGRWVEERPRWTEERVEHRIDKETGEHGGADPKMCEEFLRCILENERPSASGVDGAWSVAVGEACELSRAEKRVVEIAEVLDVESELLRR